MREKGKETRQSAREQERMCVCVRERERERERETYEEVLSKNGHLPSKVSLTRL